MKLLIFLLTLSFSLAAFPAGITGRVNSLEGCAKKVMVWLSMDEEIREKRLLLMHTEVPVGGSYKFYTKPGKYQIRANDEKGCEFFAQVEVKDQEEKMDVRMVKK